jgi:hypothetical protein
VRLQRVSGNGFSFDVLLDGTNSFQGTYDPIRDIIIMQMSHAGENLEIADPPCRRQ